MTQYNSLNVKLSNLQLNKLKSAIKNKNEVVSRLSSNMVGDDETNFPHQLLLTNRQVANLCKAFTNKSSTDIKSSKTQISKMTQLGGFLGRRFDPLLKTGLLLMKNIIKPLAKSVLIPFGLTAAASAAHARIHKKILGTGRASPPALQTTTTLIISNDEIKNIIEIVEYLEDSSLLFKGVSETIQNEAKKQKGGFPNMLLGTLGASLLGNILAGKGINTAGEGISRAGYGNRKDQKTTTKRQDHKTKWIFNATSSFN